MDLKVESPESSTTVYGHNHAMFRLDRRILPLPRRQPRFLPGFSFNVCRSFGKCMAATAGAAGTGEVSFPRKKGRDLIKVPEDHSVTLSLITAGPPL